VAISCGDAQAQLYYTTDGSAPTQASPLYTAPLEFAQPTTLRARAFGNGSTPSAQAVAYYGLTQQPADFQVTRAIDTSSPLAPVVNLTATPGSGLSGVLCYTVEEWLPPVMGAANVSAGGVFTPENGVVKWGPFFGTNAVALSYQATGLPGDYPLRLTWSVNGVSSGSQTQEISLSAGESVNTIGLAPTAPLQVPAPVL
jgi:hypothetical protein